MRVLVSGYGSLAYYLMQALCRSEHQVVALVLVEPCGEPAVTAAARHAVKWLLSPQWPRFAGERREALLMYAVARQFNVPLCRLVKGTDRLLPTMRRYQPDIFVSASLPHILDTEELAVPRYGCVNCHPSFLPEYPGPFPVKMALRDRARHTGATIHLMTEKVDEGAILWQQRIEIRQEDEYYALLEKCGVAFGTAIAGVLDRIENGGGSR